MNTPSVVVTPVQPAEALQDVRDRQRGGRLAVAAGDRDHRDAPVGARREQAVDDGARPPSRGAPAGCSCMRMPGAAFTSMIAPRCAASGRAMSRHTRSMPATSSPILRAARTQARAVSGCSSRSRLRRCRRSTDWRCRAAARCDPGRHAVGLQRLLRERLFGQRRRARIFVSTFSWPLPRAGSAFSRSTSSRTVDVPSPRDCAAAVGAPRPPPGRRPPARGGRRLRRCASTMTCGRCAARALECGRDRRRRRSPPCSRPCPGCRPAA